MNAQQDSQRSIADHVRELSGETSGFVRGEIAALRAELIEQARTMGAGAGLLAAAGFLGVGSFAAATAALVAWTGHGRAGRGGLIVAALYGASAAALARTGSDRIRAARSELADAVHHGAAGPSRG
jgi:putative superfamily III holin-X